jgi:hypothetical protein
MLNAQPPGAGGGARTDGLSSVSELTSSVEGELRSVAVEMVAINIKWTLDLGDIS